MTVARLTFWGLARIARVRLARKWAAVEPIIPADSLLFAPPSWHGADMQMTLGEAPLRASGFPGAGLQTRAIVNGCGLRPARR